MTYRCRMEGCSFSGRINPYARHIFDVHTDHDKPVQARREDMRQVMRANAGIEIRQHRADSWASADHTPQGAARWTPGDPVL
jgi:hypothetical protein